MLYVEVSILLTWLVNMSVRFTLNLRCLESVNKEKKTFNYKATKHVESSITLPSML